MEKGIYVKDIVPATEISGIFAVAQATQGQSRNGPYWRLTLTDRSGSVEAKIWHPLSASYTAIPAGKLLWLRARAGLYREQVQLSVEALQLLTDAECAELDLADFMPACPENVDAMLARLDALCLEEFSHGPWLRLVQSVMQDADVRAALRVAPAAKGVHHAYAGGLLEHTLSVFELCRHLADHYPQLDRQTLLAGALFHDIGKLRELSGGLNNDYTDAGRLMGHIMLGVEMLEPYLVRSGLDAALQLHVKHLVLSHHGQLEFGAVRQPQTAEALALHYADNLDAKLAQCRGLFAQLGAEERWTPYQATLGRALYRAEPTPSARCAEAATAQAESAATGGESARSCAEHIQPHAEPEPYPDEALPADMPAPVSVEEWASLEAAAEAAAQEDCCVEAVTEFDTDEWADGGAELSGPAAPAAGCQATEAADTAQSLCEDYSAEPAPRAEAAHAAAAPELLSAFLPESLAGVPQEADNGPAVTGPDMADVPDVPDEASDNAHGAVRPRKRKKAVREECLSLLKV